jgi:glycosyltransferase involved in cell wall biosynthesis
MLETKIIKQNVRKKILIISANYPFVGGESFLENEINFLASYFDIVVLPFKKEKRNDVLRSNLPSNLKYQPPLISGNYFIRLMRGVFNSAPIIPFIREVYLLLKLSENYFWSTKIFVVNFLNYRTLLSDSFFKKSIDGDEFYAIYFYWGNSPIKLFNSNLPVYCRIHSQEVDKEYNFNYIQSFIVNKNVTYLAISELKRTQLLAIEKTLRVFINRLGTYDFGVNNLSNIKHIRVVTCSDMIPLKRIHLIVLALQKIETHDIEWIHFGDGPLFKELFEKTKYLPKNIKVDFVGRKHNHEIMEYYQNNYVDLFVNVSYFEGVPVSIMEAMSFGIPCFATKAGATNEIVDNSVGMIVERDFDVLELAKFIVSVKANNHLRQNARNRWHNLSNANLNYMDLVSILNTTNFN